ncbi:cation efflux protein [Emericellopsis atlantica]|uniref:Cation efflux protein n=1 Tax=Emericellopsis atlantica TaxID=2614577 RepID=A0A9P8CMV7_9HYPO|nr:cation efflux protein [Emericellopsis atlantica]KAG9252420.1 cation efflux protein [Emericellopsis atlantica]
MAWSKSKRITIMLVIDTTFFLLELVVGMALGSLALMADAFHMLNDIISLLVGLWAVKAARKPRSDRFSFGWLRAEILGAFFNAVFLIALCFSIILEAITRLLDPPEIGNSKLILIVGSVGLASNLAGFFVLGGHSHAQTEHGHPVNDVRTVEEGQRGSAGAVESESSDRTRPALRAQVQNSSPSETDAHPNTRRRSSRLGDIVDGSMYPGSFRQGIISASKPTIVAAETTTMINGFGDDVTEVPSETSSLLHSKSCSATRKDPKTHSRTRGTGEPQTISPHTIHKQSKPVKMATSDTDMGTRAMILHVIGDALGNVGVIISALIIWLTPWSGRFYADPAVSLFIAVIILKTTIPLTTASAKILLQGTPDHLDINDIKDGVQKIPGVINCHHVHLWQLSEAQPVASLHIQLDFPIEQDGVAGRYMTLAKAVRECLHGYGIHSATIQPEFCLNDEHDHADQAQASTSLDGSQSARQVEGLDKDECLIGCVDDCKESCCFSLH